MAGGLNIFHFNCSFCGAKPGRVPLGEFLDRWRVYDEAPFVGLVRRYAAILTTLHDAPIRWKTKRFAKALTPLLVQFDAVLDRGAVADAERYDRCPLCETPSGPVPHERYFTDWDTACGVQVSNVIYESNLVFFAVARALPAWASPRRFAVLGAVIRLNYRLLCATGLMECGFCGRHTTCLYGDGSARYPYRCRWCLDASGGCGVTVAIAVDGSMQMTAGGETIEFDRGGKVVCRTDELRMARLGEDIVPFRKESQQRNKSN